MYWNIVTVSVVRELTKQVWQLSVSYTHLGTLDGEATTSKEFMLTPNLPRFVRVGEVLSQIGRAHV